MRVLVVGGGLVGLSAAWWLTREGHGVTLLEQGSLPNPAASSWDRHRLIRLAHGRGDGRARTIQEAYAAYDRLFDDLGRRHGIETGMLMLLRDPGDWAADARRQFDDDGTPHEVWPPAELAGRCPWLLPDPARLGIFTAQGGMLLAERIVTDLLGWLGDHGAELRPGCTVTAIEPAAARVTLADGTKLAADALVLAAGAWSGRLLPELAPALTPHRNIVAYLTPPADLANAWAGSPCVLDFGGSSEGYLLPPVLGWPLKVSAGAHWRPGDPGAPRDLDAGEPASLLALFRPYLAQLDRYAIGETRVCYTTYTSDERFVAGTLGGGATAYATGCSGQMAKFAASMGRRLALAVTGAADGAELSAWARGEVTAAAVTATVAQLGLRYQRCSTATGSAISPP